MSTHTEFREGDVVRYLPHHVQGNLSHPDCERGTVTSIAGNYVRVRFGSREHSKSCLSYQLLLVRRCSNERPTT